MPWTYTVGLSWHLDHPELVVVGMDPPSAAGLLDQVVDRIRQGTTLAVGQSLAVLGGELRFGAVDHRNLRGEWFAQWRPIAHAAGHGGASLRALQVRLPAPDGSEALSEQRALEQDAVATVLDDVAGWGALIAEALRETGGPLTDVERAWPSTVTTGGSTMKPSSRWASEVAIPSMTVPP